MKLFAGKIPWYAGGLAFECLCCGRCCAGPQEGYVWLGSDDIDAIAKFLNLPAEQVMARYVRRVSKKFSLREDPSTKDCLFLITTPNAPARCMIYPVRPVQCRTWPFWPINLLNSDCWCQAGLRCPGINRGPLHSQDEIQQKRYQTNP